MPENLFDKLAFYLEVEHALVLGFTRENYPNMRGDNWADMMKQHRETTKCSVCDLLKEVGYYGDAV